MLNQKRMLIAAAALLLAFPGCAGKAGQKEKEQESRKPASVTAVPSPGLTAAPAVPVKPVTALNPSAVPVKPVTALNPSAAPVKPAAAPKPSAAPVKPAATPKPSAAPEHPSESELTEPPGAPEEQSAPPEEKNGPSPAASAGGEQIPEPVHVHQWAAETKQVYHEAVTQQVWVVDREAWEEPVYEEQPVYMTIEKTRCKYCGEEFLLHSDWKEHRNALIDAGDYTHGSYEVVWDAVQTGTQTVQTGTIVHPEEGHYETVVQIPAYEETVITGYRCPVCGAVQ